MNFAKRYFQIGILVGTLEFLRVFELLFPAAFANYGLFLLSFLVWIPVSAIAIILFFSRFGSSGWVYTISPFSFLIHLVVQFVLLLAVGRDRHSVIQISNQVSFGALYLALNLWLLVKLSRAEKQAM